MDSLTKWEYRVETLGSFRKALTSDTLEQILNAWGEEGWEVISVSIPNNTNKYTVVAKRLMTARSRRRRSMPDYN